MEKAADIFNSFTNVMDRDVKGVQIGCYCVALAGLTIALRKVRPFSKFIKPSDIPNHFIRERRELTGLVTGIEPSEVLLMVKHKPLINIPVIPSGHLPIKISGVKVTNLGLNWLQATVVQSQIKFVPVLKEKDFVQCEVLLLPTNKEMKANLINIGEKLVQIGFGQTQNIEKPLIEDPTYLIYYNRLKVAQKYAIRKQLGFKYYIKPTRKALAMLYKYLVTSVMYTSGQISKLSQKIPKIYAT